MTLDATFILCIILKLNLIYSFSFVIDQWGEIQLPFRTQYCQHILPVKNFAKYECLDGPAVRKSVYEEILCEAGSHNKNITISEASNDTDIASIKFDCDDDLNADTTATTSSPSTSENVISIHAVCDLEPPGERDIYLAIDECFLLSNKTITTTNNGTSISSQQVLWAKLGCDFDGNTKFVTNLYNDALCETSVITRSIEILECEPWLYENETDFGFDIYATMFDCDESAGNRLSISQWKGVLMVIILMIMNIFSI